MFFPLVLMSQFPTAIGTKWEFIQFFEDNPHPMSVMNAFTDEVVADTVVGGQTYHKVERLGRMYNGSGFSWGFDTVDGIWYYRVQGSQVKVLDTVISGQPQERLLYEFGLSNGDSVLDFPMNLMNVTPSGANAYFLKYYEWDSLCGPSSGTCDSNWTKEAQAQFPPWNYGTHTFATYRNMVFEPDFGMMFSQPYQIVLDVFGQYYILGKLTSGGQTLYEHPMLMTGIDGADLLAEVEAYPNPTQGRLKLSATEPIVAVEVLNMLGASTRRIAFEQHQNEQQLDLTGLPKGSYFLVIKGANARATKMIVLE